ncbi:hypothetical protein HDU91_003651, partial [Kappamyces sp. JEL0680]
IPIDTGAKQRAQNQTRHPGVGGHLPGLYRTGTARTGCHYFPRVSRAARSGSLSRLCGCTGHQEPPLCWRCCRPSPNLQRHPHHQRVSSGPADSVPPRD